MPQEYGRRLMPVILREEAKQNPNRTFAIISQSSDSNNTFSRVTFQQIANAVNFLSHWLRARFDNNGKLALHTTLAYVGVPDLRYNIFFYAAIQCRYKVFLPSPRNPNPTNVSLMEQIQCQRLVYSIEVAAVAQKLLAAMPTLSCQELPSLSDLLSAPASNYAYDFAYEDVFREPILVLHSSGSTGQPKPVTNTHGTFATYDVRDWPKIPGRSNHDGLSTLRFQQPDSCIYDVFPPFHIAGFMTKIMVPLYNLTTVIFGPPLRPPSGALAAEIIRQHKPRGAVLPPSITEQLYHEADGADLFKQLDVLLFAGGPLPQVVGDEISKYTTLCQFYGSTEMSQIRQLIPQPDDWSYIEFHPYERFEMQPAGDDLFELVALADKDLGRTSSLYHNYPGIREWRTKDLFQPHPSKPDLWKFHARVDDILVFSSGEKLNPIPMESSLCATSGVSGALVVGQGQPQAALLLELSPSTPFTDQKSQLQLAISHANSLSPAHGRISDSMIIIANPDKPFVRAGKGTVVRRLTEELYAAEILQVYEVNQTVVKGPQEAIKPLSLSAADLKTFVRDILDQVVFENTLDEEDNFYANGIDSVTSLEISGNLKKGLSFWKSDAELKWLTLETVYKNPSIRQLSLVLVDFLNQGFVPEKRDRTREMQAKIAEYVASLPQEFKYTEKKSVVKNSAIAITGTTGFFGGYLLAALLESPYISRVYCLNRSPRAQQIFEEQNVENAEKAVFLHTNFILPDLGLCKKDYARLCEDCNVILHNAWRVDFNLTLGSFEDNLQSVKNLVLLSTNSSQHCRIVFISSVSSTGVFAHEGESPQAIPERIVDDLKKTFNNGYAESKHVAEHILAQSVVPVTILRMGQLSPSSTDNTWPENDLIPIFLRACKVSGFLASDFLDVVDWITVDQAAAITKDLIESVLQVQNDNRVKVHNVVNPISQQWETLLSTLEAWCGPDVAIVSMKEWVVNLQRQSDSSKARTPESGAALRLISSFESMTRHGPTHRYEMKELMERSGCMRNLRAVDDQMLNAWLQTL